MFVNFSEETRHLLKQAEREKEELIHPYVGSEHLLLSILKDSKLVPILKKHRVTYKKFKEKLVSLVGIGTKKNDFVLYTPLLKRVLENAVIEAREDNSKSVNPELLIINILDEEDGVAYTILRSMKVNLDRLYFDLRNVKNVKSNKKKKLLLDDLGVDMTRLAKEKKLDPVIGREKEINKALEILLRRKKNNPILIGPAGVGKTAIVEGIALLMVSDKCPSFLKDKKIISLNIFQLVSGTKYRGEFEEKMKTLIKELEDNSDIILFIDEIHTMVGAGGAEGAIDASNIFKPALARGMIRIIGATTLDEYKKFIEPDAALARRFQSVNVEEPSLENVIKILKGIKPLYEKYHDITIGDDLLKDIVFLSEKYLNNRFEPDRSIDILDEVCAKASVSENYNERKKRVFSERLERIKNEKVKALSKKNFKRAYELKTEENKLMLSLQDIKKSRKKVTKKEIIDVIKAKGNVMFFSLEDKRQEFYKSLEAELNSVIYGQEKNIEKLVRSLRKKELLEDKSCYSIHINGNHGVGKTLLAQNYSKKLVNEKNIINIDGSEYTEHHTISKLIGTTAGYLGYDNKNNIFERIRTNPNSAIIVDNYDEACDEFKNLFIRILQFGKVEDAAGKTIDFSNTVIFFITCNTSDHKQLGFSKVKKHSFSDDDRLLGKVSVSIEMEDPCDLTIKKIIEDNIHKVIKKYKQIKVSYDEGIINHIFNNVSSTKDYCSISKLVENEFEFKIMDAVLDNKKEVAIKMIKERKEAGTLN